MGITPRAFERLAQAGITVPTPIQAQAIPHALAGKDVMGLAQTGTGKTAAFALPLIHALETSGAKAGPKAVRSLILAPTRELANQIADAITSLAIGAKLKVGVVFGGASIFAQTKRLSRGTDILVATPGRLMDLLDRRALTLDAAEFLILDEADQMLDMGFLHALRQIAPLLPAKRQTMLFSATMPKQMAEVAATFLKNPVRIETARPGIAADKITQSVHFVEQGTKPRLLRDLLNAHPGERALIFARTKHGAERMMTQLVRDGYPAGSIHGDKRQRERQRTLDDFRSGHILVLVATDVAARGIDVPDVRYVYNFDLPNVAENYVHRIGRTARAGNDGAAVALCAPHEMDDFVAIERTLGTTIPVGSGTPWRTGTGPAQKKKSRGRRPPQGGFSSGRPPSKHGGNRERRPRRAA